MNHAGHEKEWEIMFQRFAKETDAAEKVKLMNGLAGIRTAPILEKYVYILI